MSGYTPVFDSVFEGTLCGRWPTLPVWLTILPMADKNGLIDKTLRNISLISGWPENLLEQAIEELMQPDPASRSGADDGRRLVLIDSENRGWGWRVVNHSKYREKGRKAAYDAERTASGHDAERKRASRDVPTPPAMSRAVPLSDSDSDSDSDKNKNQEMSGKPDRSPAKPLNGEAVLAVFAHWQTVWGHPQAKLDPKRKATIAAALKLGYDVETLCQSISGYQNSDHHTGKNERSAVFDELTLFLRDAEHIDAGLGHLKNPNKEKGKWV